jgi:hypothetical protein
MAGFARQDVDLDPLKKPESFGGSFDHQPVAGRLSA